MKVLFAASECTPIVKVGGLADVVGSLPKALSKLGIEAAVAIPNYQAVKDKPKTLPGSNVPIFYLGGKKEYPGVVYPGGYQESERFAKFSEQVVNFLDTRQFEPDIIHCHDYHTSLIIDIIKQRKTKTATILTIHDAQNLGLEDESVLELLGLSSGFLRALGVEPGQRDINALVQGAKVADIVNTVSPTYAREMLKPEISGPLSEVLNARRARVFGILNGIDTDYYDPSRDRNLFQTFGAGNAVLAKQANKKELQKELGLKVNESRPLFGLVTRLVERKGIDLVIENLPKLLEEGGQLVVLAKGEPHYEEMLKGLAGRFLGQFAFVNEFSEPLSHKIYAASDFFLVPSRTEPCGLTQMIAMRYGSLPVVHATGGLADTVVEPHDGFVFEDYSSADFWQALARSLDLYNHRSGNDFRPRLEAAMKKDFSWEASSRSYIKLYEKALEYSFGIARGVTGEVRGDLLGGWTLLSEGRAKRPFLIKKPAKAEAKKSSTEVDLASCPFEEGHEGLSPNEVFRVGFGQKDGPGWEVRVVPNKYPLLPAHEVFVYSPNHFKDLSDLPPLWLEKVVWAYLSRYRHYEDKGYVHIFCNHGKAAAASLGHPHSQLLVLDELPQSTLAALDFAGRYFEDHHHCPYCDTLLREIPNGPHLIYQTEEMMLATPYSSQWPYELTIIPKRHRASFGNINDDELKSFARMLALAIKILKEELGEDISYNFWIHSLPPLLGLGKTALYYHWHLDLVPRIKSLGGLELGLGVMVDDMISPEKAALELRQKLSQRPDLDG